MSTFEEVKQAITSLAPAELRRFRRWFEAFEAARFDEKIEQDAHSGRLDRFGDLAVANFRKGLAREL